MNTYHQIVQFADEVSRMNTELQQLRTSDAALRAERWHLRDLIRQLNYCDLPVGAGVILLEIQDVLKC